MDGREDEGEGISEGSDEEEVEERELAEDVLDLETQARQSVHGSASFVQEPSQKHERNISPVPEGTPHQVHARGSGAYGKLREVSTRESIDVPARKLSAVSEDDCISESVSSNPTTSSSRRYSLLHRALRSVRVTARSIMNNTAIALEHCLHCLPIEDPQTKRRKCWDGLIFTLVMYTIIIIPLQIGFRPPQTTSWIAQELVVSSLFALDVLYNFCTAYVNDKLNLVTNRAKIAREYLRGWFIIDLVASVPFDLLALASDLSNSNNELAVLSFLKAPRLLRLGRFMRVVERMRNASAVKIARLLLLMFLFAHWIGSIYYLIGRLAPDDRSWIPEMERQIQGSLGDITTAYWVSLFRALLIMLGQDVEPNNTAERVFSTFSLIFGALYWATVVGIMSLLATNYNRTATEHRRERERVQDTLRYLDVPHYMTERVHMYYDYLVSFTHPSPRGIEMLKELPRPLYREVCNELYAPMIQRVPIFSGKHIEHDFIIDIAMRLKPAVYLPGEYIFLKGQTGMGMYFIVAGTVQVQDESGNELLQICDKGFFGDIATLATRKRTASVQTVTHCDCMFLSRKDLVASLSNYPRSARSIWLFAYDWYGSLLDLETDDELEIPQRSAEDGGKNDEQQTEGRALHTIPTQEQMMGMKRMAVAQEKEAPRSSTLFENESIEDKYPRDSLVSADASNNSEFGMLDTKVTRQSDDSEYEKKHAVEECPNMSASDATAQPTYEASIQQATCVQEEIDGLKAKVRAYTT